MTWNFFIVLDDRDDAKSIEVLKELENIDDECDEKGLPFVKIDDDSVAKEFGIDDVCILYWIAKLLKHINLLGTTNIGIFRK